MAFRLNRLNTAFNGSKKVKPVQDADYLAWLHELPCCISGRRPVEAAHVSFANLRAGATGRGMSQKASDRFALPLHADLHRILPEAQHNHNEQEWWDKRGIDPHYLALALYGAFHERNAELAQMILMAHWRT